MVGRMSDWKDELGRWLKPFLDRLGHKARRQMCPLYVSALIGPGDRKSIQPMAERLALGEYDQLHHFIGAGGMRRRWKMNCLFSPSTLHLGSVGSAIGLELKNTGNNDGFAVPRL
jgi:hypothetical protein